MRLIQTIFIGFRFFLGIRKNNSLNLAAIVAAFSICVGVTTITIATSIINGFEHAILKHSVGMTSDIVTFYKTSSTNWKVEQKILKDLKNILVVEPFVRKEALIESGDKLIPVVVEAVLILKNTKSIGLPKFLDLSKLRNKNNILIGNSLYQKLNTSVGKKVTLITADSAPVATQLEVSGHFKVGLHQIDSRFTIMDLEAAQELFELGNYISGFRIYLKNSTDALNTASLIKEKLDDRFEIYPWTVFNQQFFLAIKSQKKLLFVILSLITVVASFNVGTAIILAVKEKKEELKQLKRMGATHHTLAGILIILGLLISTLGIIAGLILGISLAFLMPELITFLEDLVSVTFINPEIYYVDHLPVRIKILDLAVITASSITIVLIASYVSSRFIAKISEK